MKFKKWSHLVLLYNSATVKAINDSCGFTPSSLSICNVSFTVHASYFALKGLDNKLIHII